MEFGPQVFTTRKKKNPNIYHLVILNSDLWPAGQIR
jgi:hypothetical protein